MNDQLGLSCAWLPARYQDHGSLGTSLKDRNTRSRFANGFDSAAPVQQKLTSAALRSPMISSMSATRTMSEYPSQDRIGEMPVPAMQGYDQRSLHSALAPYSMLPSAGPREQYAQPPAYSRQQLLPQTPTTAPLVSLHEQWSSFWQSSCGTYDQPSSNNGATRLASSASLNIGAPKRAVVNHSLVTGAATTTPARPTWSQVTGSTVATKDTKKWDLQRAVQPPPRTSQARVRSPGYIEETSTDGGDDDEDALRPKANNATKLLSDSLAFSISAVNNPPALPTKFPVIKISNIPWSISVQEIEELFSYVKLPTQHQLGQSIHILINKSTGKTQSEAYIELATEHDAYMAIKQFPHVPIKGRKLFIGKSSQDKLFQKIFPQWKGTFMDGRPFFLNERGKPVDITTITPPPLVERQEFESILAICRNYKLHFSRKCGERPFESLISIMVKFPWDKPNIITTMQRDHLYEYFKLATGVLHNHLSKAYCTLDKGLMQRMVHAALTCPGLTVPQKKGILTASGGDCPEELAHFIVLPEDSSNTTEDDDEMSLAQSYIKL